MKKVLNEAMINEIAKRIRKQFKEGTRIYSFYYYIIQEAIEDVVEMDGTITIKKIDINKEFTEYINDVLSVLNYPSRYDLDNTSQALVNSLYNIFFGYIEDIVEDVKEEYTDVNIDIDNNMIVITDEY